AFIMLLTTLIVMKGLDMVAKKVDRREANHA
ncbi:MAG: ABC transporter permease, partial [Enterococcus faecalis]|nr:ABC transporter permease [Enterococcus faecalis]